MTGSNKLVDKYQYNETQVKSDGLAQLITAKHIVLKELFTLKKVCISQQKTIAKHHGIVNQMNILKNLIDKPYVVKCHKMLKTSNNLYVVYDLIGKYPTLAELIENKRLTGQNEKKNIALQILNSLKQLKALNILYLDLNTKLIEIGQDFRIKYINLQNAIYSDHNSSSLSFLNVQVSSDIAPELKEMIEDCCALPCQKHIQFALFNNRLGKVDLYAFGKILYQMFENEINDAVKDPTRAGIFEKQIKILIDKLLSQNKIERPGLEEIEQVLVQKNTVREDILKKSSHRANDGLREKLEIALQKSRQNKERQSDEQRVKQKQKDKRVSHTSRNKQKKESKEIKKQKNALDRSRNAQKEVSKENQRSKQREKAREKSKAQQKQKQKQREKERARERQKQRQKQRQRQREKQKQGERLKQKQRIKEKLKEKPQPLVPRRQKNTLEINASNTQMKKSRSMMKSTVIPSTSKINNQKQLLKPSIQDDDFDTKSVRSTADYTDNTTKSKMVRRRKGSSCQVEPQESYNDQYKRFVLKVTKRRNLCKSLLGWANTVFGLQLIEPIQRVMLGFMLVRKSVLLICSLARYISTGKGQSEELDIKEAVRKEFCKTNDYLKLSEAINSEMDSARTLYQFIIALLTAEYPQVTENKEFNFNYECKSQSFNQNFLKHLIKKCLSQVLRQLEMPFMNRMTNKSTIHNSQKPPRNYLLPRNKEGNEENSMLRTSSRANKENANISVDIDDVTSVISARTMRTKFSRQVSGDLTQQSFNNDYILRYINFNTLVNLYLMGLILDFESYEKMFQNLIKDEKILFEQQPLLMQLKRMEPRSIAYKVHKCVN